MKEKNLELERLVFFSDAIVAIAITILVFNLKITGDEGRHFTFADLLQAWPKSWLFFFPFLLSLFFGNYTINSFFISKLLTKLCFGTI